MAPAGSAVHQQSREDHWGQLIGRVAAGDEHALAALYDGTAALVHGLAIRVLGDRSAAEEVTGDVYLRCGARPLATIGRAGRRSGGS